ncbi:DUF257 domain-containing protein [Thermococcus aggregans]|uniref:DUF257 domain-containing protein n=1 Tax=Thermococcus aggregans TaxID=110163 RepID=A0A9E7SNU8_THEAG|nr:DUF257 family protein [Thermococcus aggregans]USS40645.1 DUF257 domain-containing protein [Thermococcus aggregans]
METTSLAQFLRTHVSAGDLVIVEYPSTYPLENLVWGELVPSLSGHEILIDDFFGVGDLLFRDYIRKSPPEKYKLLMELTKRIKAIRIGPGRTSYASIVEEIPTTYDIPEFMKNYYDALTKISSPSTKIEYLMTLGISQYVYFGGDRALRAILFTRSMLPFEDWTSIYFVNSDIMNKQQIAIFRELASKVIKVKKEEHHYKLEIEE